MHRSIGMDPHAASIAGTEYCVCCIGIRVRASQVREAIHVKFVPGALNPTGKPDYEGNTYKYWHAGQNNTGWNYVSAAALRAATGRRSSATHVACLVHHLALLLMDAWHRGSQNQSRMHLLDVYPELIASYRTLIFNGDFDACVPYLHNERWTQHLAEEQGWETLREWQAWQMDEQVAGYVTTFGGGDVSNFTFAT